MNCGLYHIVGYAYRIRGYGYAVPVSVHLWFFCGHKDISICCGLAVLHLPLQCARHATSTITKHAHVLVAIDCAGFRATCDTACDDCAALCLCWPDTCLPLEFHTMADTGSCISVLMFWASNLQQA